MKQLHKLASGILALSLLLLLCACGGDSGPSAGQESGTETGGGTPAQEESGAETGGGTPVQEESGTETDSGTAAQDEPAAETEPSAAPIRFEGTDLEGNVLSEAVFSQSKLTMLNVWATYCSPCLSEMPDLGELAAEYDTEEFQIIGIVSDVLEGEDTELAENLIQETGAAYPHLLLNESIYNALLTDVTAVPTTCFFDREGTLLDTVVGAMEKSAWEEIIHGLLEGQ